MIGVCPGYSAARHLSQFKSSSPLVAVKLLNKQPLFLIGVQPCFVKWVNFGKYPLHAIIPCFNFPCNEDHHFFFQASALLSVKFRKNNRLHISCFITNCLKCHWITALRPD